MILSDGKTSPRAPQQTSVKNVTPRQIYASGGGLHVAPAADKRATEQLRL